METDSKILYKTIIRSNRQGDWRVQPYVADILGKKVGFEEVKFVKIKRSADRKSTRLNSSHRP